MRHPLESPPGSSQGVSHNKLGWKGYIWCLYPRFLSLRNLNQSSRYTFRIWWTLMTTPIAHQDACSPRLAACRRPRTLRRVLQTSPGSTWAQGRCCGWTLLTRFGTWWSGTGFGVPHRCSCINTSTGCCNENTLCPLRRCWRSCRFLQMGQRSRIDCPRVREFGAYERMWSLKIFERCFC